ncbi:MAG TPA: phosphatase PAP2 family protein [Polyangiaceae bacterium]|jgi:membrane-associated phospholipid phosphatase|nr:phosphatase PAP2 family protein [Polyangiaceae bacterium]
MLVGETASAMEPTVSWNPAWPTFRVSEAGATLALGIAAGAAAFLYPEPGPRWNGSLPFDEAGRNLLRLSDRSARQSVAHASDLIYYGLTLYPAVVDAGIVTLGVHRRPFVALQMALIDLETYAFTGAIALSAEKVGRVRPMARECARDPNYDYKCNSQERLDQSFLSGHTTVAFSGAGLICVHHQHLPLYGGGIADPIACATGMLAATAAGVMRIMSDNHYTSDVALGAAVGIAGGYVLPSLLHYGFGSSATPSQSLLPSFELGHGSSAIFAAVTPAVTAGYAGLSLVGISE